MSASWYKGSSDLEALSFSGYDAAPNMSEQENKIPIGPVAIAAIAILLIGLLLGRFTAPADNASVAAQVAKDGKKAGDAILVTDPGIALDIPDTKAGAVQFASLFVTSFPTLAKLDDKERQKTVNDLLSPLASSDLRYSILHSHEAAGSFFGPDSNVRVMPVAYKVTSYSDDQTNIRIWSQLILVDEKKNLAASAWVLNDVTLSWAVGRWGVQEWATQRGPEPMPLNVDNDGPVPASSEQLNEIFTDFKEYRYATSS